MISIETIKQKLASLKPISLLVIDESELHKGHSGYSGKGPSHVRIEIVSSLFVDMPLIKRHKMIQDLLKHELQNGLHALSIKADTL